MASRGATPTETKIQRNTQVESKKSRHSELEGRRPAGDDVPEVCEIH